MLVLIEPLAKNRTHVFLVVVSLFFYSFAGLPLVALIIVSSLSDFVISSRLTTQYKKFWLFLGIGINLAFLFGVKIHYYYAINTQQEFSLIPLGISFYALQSISYLIDVYKGKVARIEKFMHYLAYISFFPQLISGPIERCKKLYPQLALFRLAEPKHVLFGIRLFVIGMYLKLVIANRLAQPVISVAESLHFDLYFFINGVMVFIYVYSDFFAYTLMARGIAAMFNINLSINFDRPFKRKTLSSFWGSWHMSLTNWMKDYFYIPIMLSLKKTFVQKIIFSGTTMVLVGLWHGIGWNFVLFGLINGIMMQLLPVLDRTTAGASRFIPRFNNRLGLLLVMAVSGNLFLHGSTEQLQAFLILDNYSLDFMAIPAEYIQRVFFVGLLATIPLWIHEFSNTSIFYRDFGWLKNVFIIFGVLTIVVLFGVPGGEHVYFAF